jgi:chromosome segregation ATPase
MDNKELVWVEKEFAEKYKMLEGKKEMRELQIAEFEEYMKKVQDQARREFRANLENLDEDCAIFSGLMLKVKQSFEKAKNEHLDASYALWEKFEKEIPDVRKKIQTITETVTPLKKELEDVNALLAKINTYDLDRVIEAIGKLNNLYGTSREMVDFLVNNFKK